MPLWMSLMRWTFKSPLLHLLADLGFYRFLGQHVQIFLG